MRDINTIILTGRLTADPEAKFTNNNTPTASFSLAVNRSYFKKDDPNAQTTDFFRCHVFGKMAETVKQYYKKGMKAFVRGRLQSGRYQNKDGITVYTTDVVVEDIGFGESKSAAGNGGAASNGGYSNNSSGGYNGNSSGGFSGGYQNTNNYVGGQINVPETIPEGTNEELPFS